MESIPTLVMVGVVIGGGICGGGFRPLCLRAGVFVDDWGLCCDLFRRKPVPVQCESCGGFVEICGQRLCSRF